MPEKECFLRQVGVLPSAAPMLHARREVLDGHIPRKDKEGRASGIGWSAGDHLGAQEVPGRGVKHLPMRPGKSRAGRKRWTNGAQSCRGEAHGENGRVWSDVPHAEFARRKAFQTDEELAEARLVGKV